MRYYEILDERTVDGFSVVIDKTYEDIDPWDQLSECFDDRKQLYADIDSGKYDWFMLRVRAFFGGHEVGCSYLGGCLYMNPEDVLKDGTVEDQLITVLAEAEAELARMREMIEGRFERA